MDQRLAELQKWLEQDCQFANYHLKTVAGGASFRRYFRLTTDHHGYIVMDAPPGREDVADFIAIDETFLSLGLSVPKILRQQQELGFLLLEDFGDDLYFNILTNDNVDDLYNKAFDAILKIQSCQDMSRWSPPHLNYDFMLKELQDFQEWYLIRHLQRTISQREQVILDEAFEMIASVSANQQPVCIHRDYHTQNLMLLQNNEIGILDFQNAMLGPITYDFVSLVKDCYKTWPDEKIHAWIVAFQKRLLDHGAAVPRIKEQFIRDVEIMGLQRHLKAILTYARKKERDSDGGYLQFIPVALNYISNLTRRYSEFIPLVQVIQGNTDVKEE